MPVVPAEQKSDYYKNFIKVFSGNALAQLASLAAIPLITRLYRPEDLGVANTVVMAANLAVIFASLRMDLAIFIRKDRNEQEIYEKIQLGLVALSIFFIVTVCAAFTISITVSRELAVQALSFGAITFVIGIFNLALSVFNIKKKYTHFAMSRVVMTWLGVLLKLLLGWLLLGWIGFLIAVFLSYAVVAIWALWVVKNDFLKVLGCRSSLKDTWKRNDSFIKFNVSTNFLNSLGQFVPVLLLSVYMGAHAVGLYTLAITVLRAPVNLLAEAVRKVFIQEASEYISSHKHKELTSKFDITTVLLFLVAATGLAIGAVVVSNYSTVIFGNEWAELGSYMAILAPWFVFLMCNSPATCLYTVTEKHKFMFKYEIVFMVARALSLTLPLSMGASAKSSLIFFVMTNCIFNIFYIANSRAVLKNNYRGSEC